VKLNIVPARTGIQWVKLGIVTFLRQPLALAGLFFMYMAAVLVVAMVPVVGMVIGSMLVPAATLGLMAATAEASKGRFPMPSVLLSAFRAGRQRGAAMLQLGLMYTAGSFAATLLGELLVGGAPTPAPAAGAEAAMQQIDPRMLAVMALHAPLALLFWHAPALVHWHGISPAKSLFFSGVACLRNFGAMLVYGLAWMGVFLLAGFALSAIGAALGGASAVRAVLMPAVLLMASMFTTSLYFTFRDSFLADTPEATEPTEPHQPPPGGDTPS